MIDRSRQRQIDGEHGHEAAHHERRQPAPRQRDEQALRGLFAHEAPPRRAQRAAHGKLPLPRRASREDEVRQVRARDRQDEQHQPRHHDAEATKFSVASVRASATVRADHERRGIVWLPRYGIVLGNDASRASRTATAPRRRVSMRTPGRRRPTTVSWRRSRSGVSAVPGRAGAANHLTAGSESRRRCRAAPTRACRTGRTPT